LADKLRGAGVDADLMLVPDTGHGDLNNQANFAPVLDRLIAFLARL
jgi:dipeptidyl aminopeptidase/acylaminoacyl peptidase